jgi:hypothetical protein
MYKYIRNSAIKSDQLINLADLFAIVIFTHG